jgi:cytidylate kinase
VIETILKLAELGNVILIGRGANVVTAKLPHVFHVRLVGTLERRLIRVQEDHHLDRKAALPFLEKADRGRSRYVRKHFKAKIEDPLLYDMVINTDRIPCDLVAQVIGEALLGRAGIARPDA